MAIFLSKRELAQTEPAERVAFRSPVPTPDSVERRVQSSAPDAAPAAV
jgi:hypothetical protein